VEQLANNPVTTLNGAINNSTTTVVVTDASTFSTSGNFTIKIGTELLKVTSVSSNTFTASRGQEGTTAASHADLDAVSQVVSKRVIDQLYLEMCQVGGYSSRPSTARANSLYYANDIDLAWRSDGTNWSLFKPTYVPYANRLNTSGWTSLNFGSSVWTEINGVLCAEMAIETQVRGKYHSLPTAPFNAYVCLGSPPYNQATEEAGIMLYDSGTGKLKVIGRYSFDNGQNAAVSNWTTTSSFSSHVAAVQLVPGQYTYFRFQDDNTNWNYYASLDGSTWIKYYTETRNTFLTPNAIGLCHFRDTSIMSIGKVYENFYAYWEV